MIPNRIEAYCDLSGFTFLREYAGEICSGPCRGGTSVQSSSNIPRDYPVVVAEEIDGNGKVVRSWFVMLQSSRDGCLSSHCDYAHRVVSRRIRPGEPTPDYDPNVSVAIGAQVSEEQLRRIQRARDGMLADRERHVIYAQAYLDAVQRANDSEAATRKMQEQLTAQAMAQAAALQKRDNEIFELKNETTLNRLHIATLQASYAALENRKSLTERVKVWFRSMLTKCALKQAE